MRTSRKLSAGVALGVVASTVLAGCAKDQPAPGVVTVIHTVTAGAPSASTPSVPANGSTTAAPRRSSSLTTSFSALSLSQPVGVAIVPVGGGDPILLGDQTPQVAWSTIKVPLALAAQRAHGSSAAETNAIVSSDNASAEALWASLGSGAAASQAVTAVLREGGDGQTTVPSEKLRPEFTVFGQTVWPLANAATFTANLPCLPGSRTVVSLMEGVADNQQWGLKSIASRTTAVKGGWGPSASGGYVVRQIGLVERRDGRQAAVAMSTYAPGGSLDSGIAALNQVGQWLGRRIGSLPAGRC